MDQRFVECLQEVTVEHTPTEQDFLPEEVIPILLRAGTQQEQRVVVRVVEQLRPLLLQLSRFLVVPRQRLPLL